MYKNKHHNKLISKFKLYINKNRHFLFNNQYRLYWVWKLFLVD